jgi:hypothetical protein
VCVGLAFLAAALLWAFFGGLLPARAEQQREEVRSAMLAILSGVKIVLPLSVSDEQFRDPASAPEVRAALERIAAGASMLGEHIVTTRGEGFQFLGHELEQTARETVRAYDLGRYDVAEYQVHRMTEYCVACHSRLPSDIDSPLAEDFIDGTDLTVMPLQERAKLQLATRLFDDALASYEALLASPVEHPATLLGPLTDYVTVSIRVKNDPSRPIPVLEDFAARADLWEYLRLDVERWLADLRELEGKPEPPATLKAGRDRIEHAKRSIHFPADRRALIDYVVASAILHRYLESGPTQAGQAAEAYYLLGMTESRIGRNYWISQADFYLETAIRLAPAEPFALDAYALLEEETVLGYTGSSGTHLPEDVAKRLKELRALIGGSAKPTAP